MAKPPHRGPRKPRPEAPASGPHPTPGAARPPPPAAEPAVLDAEPPTPPWTGSTPPWEQPSTPPRGVPAAPLSQAQLLELDQRFAGLDELDYFQMLKLPLTATLAEIKAAFYRESRAYHPDRFFQLEDRLLKGKVSTVYRRLTEAYYVLRDEAKRKRYVADIKGPERAQKLRFTEASEAEIKQQVKREQEEQIGLNPKARQLYQSAMKDVDASNWASAERNLKLAIAFEPSNTRYKEKLSEVSQKLHEQARKGGHSFKIR